MDEQDAQKDQILAELEQVQVELAELRARESEHVKKEQMLREKLRLVTENFRITERSLRSTLALSSLAKREMNQVKRQAETAARAKGEFLANMSHEIRTPMTAIVGYTDLMLEEGDISQAPPSRIEYLQAVKRNGQHLMRILDDILDLSKIEAGKIEVERIAVTPKEIVDDVVGVMRQTAVNKGIGFDISYEGLIPTQVVTDPTRLRQILMNLVGNAIKFTDEGGVRIVIQMGGLDTERPMLRFDVSDTGVGLTPEARERIFEAFSQADASTTRKFGGTGLGLAISKKLADLLGGNLEVTSIENQGSTFLLTIDPGPMTGVRLVEGIETDTHDEMVGGTTPTPEFFENVKQHGPTARVLLVEDGPDNQRLVMYTLKKAGFEIGLAENGEEGVQKALEARSAGEPYDVILMDMQMPVLDGYGATRRLRGEGYLGPIIALTANAMKGDREKCLDAGCTDFATKPVNRRGLVQKILEYLDEDRSAAVESGLEAAESEVAPDSEITGESEVVAGSGPEVALESHSEPETDSMPQSDSAPEFDSEPDFGSGFAPGLESEGESQGDETSSSLPSLDLANQFSEPEPEQE
jgi:Amt family ammonium transporter